MKRRGGFNEEEWNNLSVTRWKMRQSLYVECAEEEEAHGCLGRQFLVSGNFCYGLWSATNFSRGLEAEEKKNKTQKTKRKTIICLMKKTSVNPHRGCQNKGGKGVLIRVFKTKQCKGLLSSLPLQSLSQNNPQHRSCPIPKMFLIQDSWVFRSLSVLSS